MKEFLIPSTKKNVIDLVKLAGIDISDWSNFNGKTAKTSSNPKYCYEWSFIQPNKVVVLNLWYEDILEKDGELYQEKNFREDSNYFQTTFKKTIWSNRALKMDKAIKTAVSEKLIVRVIICKGKILRRNPINPQPSKVEKRMLDPVPWTITNYDNNNGNCTISRGIKEIRSCDQFDKIDASILPNIPNKTQVTAYIYKRSIIVRKNVLSRAQDKCEYCGNKGFLTNDDKYYLETHHIIPLSENGNDDEKNVIALCPNHHRIAHYGMGKFNLQNELKEKINSLYLK